jgi:hypothetical protein
VSRGLADKLCLKGCTAVQGSMPGPASQGMEQ